MNSNPQRKYSIKSILKRGEVSLKEFREMCRIEVIETKEAKEVFVKYVGGKGVTENEKKILLTQVFDLIKIVFIGIPLSIIPGFSIVIVFIVRVGRKYKFNILPTSFARKNDD